jgi:hypothetical protein
LKAIPAVRLAIVSIVLLASSISGLYDSLELISAADTAFRKLFVVVQLLYGVSGLIAFFALVTKRKWTVWVLSVWAVSVAAAAGLAVVVWGGEGLGSAAAAGVGTALVAGLVVWGGHRAVVARLPSDEEACPSS